MGLKKKKNVIVITLLVIISFILYQLYFFLAITDASNNTSNVKYVPVDQSKVQNMKVIRTLADRYIDEYGHIRGVYSRDMRKYVPDQNKEFKCLKSEQRVLYELINDDYCDCEDGTDEPSTNACVNGTFYCQTQVKVNSNTVTTVPSSMVNDGICDCCDGSDEWLHQPKQKLLSQNIKRKRHYYVTTCPNICK